MKIIVKLGLFVLASLSIQAGKNVVPATQPIAAVEVEEASPWYLGLGMTRGYFLKTRSTCRYEDITYGGMLRGGYEWNEHFGIEARAIRTLTEEGANGGELLQHIGLFAKPSLPLSDRLNLYGLLGYGWTKSINEGGNGNLPSIDVGGVSWGLGLEYDFSDKESDLLAGADYDRDFDGHGDQGRGWTVFIDYQKLSVDSDLPDMSVISIGGRYDF